MINANPARLATSGFTRGNGEILFDPNGAGRFPGKNGPVEVPLSRIAAHELGHFMHRDATERSIVDNYENPYANQYGWPER
jgi:hypothetical protein